MFENIKWLFFDMGSTIIDEHIAYKHRFIEIAELANTTYDKVYNLALSFYKNNKRGDLLAAKSLGVELTKWHGEDEILYKDALECFKILSGKYNIGIIANQVLGSEKRLEKYGLMKYIDLVVASQEEGFSKPDKRIFEIALNRSKCKAQNSIMIGDRIDNDIVPANLLGMNTIWIKQGFGRYWNIEKENEKPNYAVNNLIELCKIL